ncbi:polysaccharide deacetylase family protein (plasmid) [Sulfitobacter sp. OXR-159]|uniref:polysaccharide deacetylase family protein n=1 Tax=Sulfitobacter sp. OXR-159 TaxID=3100174 RepID=UPI002AC8E404|nr:polysaccharide deacetylase family protein [Sulfitobacter sp. OXR-159]WPZ31811.1 polysaccharide deacetylase family protein [Sulfitobacter sp. OXR-159]
MNAHRGYHEPRATRGLSDRVFFDPSRRRKARVIFSAGTLISGVIAWLLFFAITVGLDGGLEAALPEPISTLKGHTASVRNSLLVEGEHGSDMPAIDLYAQQELQKYQCLNRTGQGAAPSQTLKVYAVVSAELPWATHSFSESCNTIHVAMPTWFHFTELDGDVQVGEVSLETRQPLFKQRTEVGTFDIMPILQWDTAALGPLRTPTGPAKVSAALSDFLDQPSQTANVKGYCIDASSLALIEGQTFSILSRRLTSQFKSRGLETCVRLPSSAAASLLVIANRFFDTVVIKGYQEHWIGSAPQPLADKRWFNERIKAFQEHVAPSKLVVELGTHSLDWVSGSPRPEVLPFAKAMTALAQHDAFATLAPGSGNTRASYLDARGLQHQLWLLDAMTAQNQILTLKRYGIQALSLSGLGYEDPGIWAVLDQTTRGMTLPSAALESVLLSNYVALTGRGPFVAPRSMPQVGKRTIKISPETGEVTSAVYDEMPQAAAGKLYGEGEPNKVVLTFDDGPHPQHTPAALDILRQTQTPASFFVLGSNALASPDLIRRILAEGHELGSHTYSHPNMAEISASRAKVEANSTQLLINGITGKNMRLYREPYMRSGGPITSKEVASLLPLEEAGYVIAGMNIVPQD